MSGWRVVRCLVVGSSVTAGTTRCPTVPARTSTGSPSRERQERILTFICIYLLQSNENIPSVHYRRCCLQLSPPLYQTWRPSGRWCSLWRLRPPAWVLLCVPGGRHWHHSPSQYDEGNSNLLIWHSEVLSCAECLFIIHPICIHNPPN